DDGEQSGDHAPLDSCCCLDPSYRIPLIMRKPGKSADKGRSSAVRSFTEDVDVRPTMLEAIGGDIPMQWAGMALRPLLEGRAEPASGRSEAHWEFDFRDPADDAAERTLGLTLHQCTMNIVRDEHYKYVHFTKLPPLLFDLQKDPGEFPNLAGDPRYVGVM